MSARTLTTDRLTLRPLGAEDVEAMIAFYVSERAAMAGGNVDAARAATNAYAMLGHWVHRGYGLFAVEETQTGNVVGMAGPYYPVGRPETEIGWVLFDGHEGKGFATEAARATLDFARKTLGWTDIVSYIAPENQGSVRVAERLGATLDTAAPQPKPGDNALVYRHPKPDEAAA